MVRLSFPHTPSLLTRSSSLFVGALLATVGLTGCAGDTTTVSDSAGGNTAAVELPTSVPAAPGKVTGLGLVMDQAGETTICFGPVGESWPPSCQGTPLAGWKWAGLDGYDKVDKVRFGSYAVTGTWDGTTLTLTDPPISAALYDPAPDPSYADRVATRCDAPAEGWQVEDAAKAGADALAQAQVTAEEQPGYVGSWTDQFAQVAVPDGADALPVVLNVLAEDPEAMTAALADSWSGALCVTEPRFTRDNLDAAAVTISTSPAVLGANVFNDEVVVDTLYDDGSLQTAVDSAYGEGMVAVQPALRDAG